jgi:redox-sensitive bicupin YhaK (pirin superfamily)
VHFLQIWLEPAARGIAPGYEEKRFEEASKRGQLRLIASPDGRDGSVTLHQDASLYAALIDGAESVQHAPAPGRRTYVHVVRGHVTVNGNPLAHGDALKLSGEQVVRLENGSDAEVLLFDLA